MVASPAGVAPAAGCTVRRCVTGRRQVVDTRDVSRRDLLRHGGAAMVGLAFLRLPEVALAFQAQPGEEVVPWLDQPAPNPVPEITGQHLQWEALDSWITP